MLNGKYNKRTCVTKGTSVCSTDFVRISSVILESLLDALAAMFIFQRSQPLTTSKFFFCRSTRGSKKPLGVGISEIAAAMPVAICQKRILY